MIILRKITENDKPLFAKWWRDVDLIKLTSGQMTPITDKEVTEYFNAMIEGQDAHFIIELDKNPIGHIALEYEKDQWMQIQIIIGKDYWGKGFGPEAIKQIIEIAKRKNISKLYLEVRPENTLAIKAYEKCGFKKTRKLNHPDNLNQPVTIRMELIWKK